MRRHMGNISIGVAGFILLLALIAPALRNSSFQRLVAATSGDVETIGAAALGALRTNGSWPAPVGLGEVPPEIAAALPSDLDMNGAHYALEWRLLNVVHQVDATLTNPPPETDGSPMPDSVSVQTIPTVRTRGAIVVHSTNDPLLAALLTQYGPDVSFVRDSTWTLMLIPNGF